MKKISFIFGTRPEAIKLTPIILELNQRKQYNINICVTAQHREMLDQILDEFDIRPDVDLNLMQSNQTLGKLTSSAIETLDKYLSDEKPDLILVQGDTTTVFAACLTAFYHQIKIGHVEAGMRTWEKFSPFPEEINRVLSSKLVDIHFSPTQLSKQNLLKDGIPENKIFVTGNPVVDALFLAKEKVSIKSPRIAELPTELMENKQSMILITGHRRESFGREFESICKAIYSLSERFPHTAFVYPVHLNPNVQEPVKRILSERHNIHLINPVSYLPFVALMIRSTIILTDSGGIQEEAPSLGIPVLVMRDHTERLEAVSAGAVKIVGTDENIIVEEASRLLTNEDQYAEMAKCVNPYGDGKAAKRIVSIIEKLS